MKRFILSFLPMFFVYFSYSQSNKIDSLDRLIAKATSDTQRINLKIEKTKILSSGNLDSAIAFAITVLNEAKKVNYKKGEAKTRIKLAGDYCFAGNYTAAKDNLDTTKEILSHLNDSLVLGNMYGTYGMMYSMQNKFDISHSFYKKEIDILSLIKDKTLLSGVYQNNAIAYQQESNYAQALNNYQQALRVAAQTKDEEGEAYIYLNIAITYGSLDENQKAEQSYLNAITLAKKLDLKNVLSYAYANIASLYGDLNEFDKEYDFATKAATLGKEMGDKGIEASSLSRAGVAMASQNKFEEAEKLNRQAIVVADSSTQPYNIYQTYGTMGYIYILQNKYSEAIPYFEKAFHSLVASDLYDREVGGYYADLSECYEKTGNFSKALASYKMAAKILDSIRGRDNIKKATELTMNYEFEQRRQLARVEQEKKDAIAKRTKNQQYFIIAALGIIALSVLIIALIQFRNNKQKKRVNTLLHQQKQKVETTLSELKSTQAQLIQSEKMASLGELTAGIAHEIQNPLNFVNNFSEVNRELIEELKIKNEELKIEDVEVNDLLNDLAANEEKINHHGKRADAIVKGMLQHSRQTKGVKELTDINALCDEYLRLSYHGLRAKDKNFNADYKTDFDAGIGKINIVPQDIGRVLLNLFNNAFYAVSKSPQSLKGSEYKPLVSVTTKKINDKVEIRVEDNGNGIPSNIIDKIFQPFFTTKPTGEGTGLGLSLAYDIITKEHSGTIKVESVVGEGSKFVIQLPMK